jgi:tetratricopeptide (TPR) repeat protein
MLVKKGRKLHASELFEQGLASYKAKDFMTALDNFRLAREQNPSLPNLNHFTGLAYLELGKTADAIALLRLALNEDPTEERYQNLAQAYMVDSDPLAAQAVVETGLEQFPESSALHFQLGVYFHYHSLPLSPGLAKQHYRLSIEYDPNNIRSLVNLGVLSQNEWDFPAALRYFELAVEVNRKSQLALENLAALSEQMGLTDRQRFALGLLMAHYPDSYLLVACNRLKILSAKFPSNHLVF